MQQLSLHCPAMPLASFQKLHGINKDLLDHLFYLLNYLDTVQILYYTDNTLHQSLTAKTK